MIIIMKYLIEEIAFQKQIKIQLLCIWNKITWKTDKGILLRKNRSIQVEGAFGVIKQDYGFRRFLMRGTKNVITEFLLIAFGYNINKLHRKTLEKRNGKLLHLKNIA